MVPADNLHTRSVGPASSFMFGRLIHADIGGLIHVVLPPAFEKDLENINFDWVPCPVRRQVWANTELVDAEGENLVHEVMVAHHETYRPDPGDKIRHSALGFRTVPLCDVTHLFNLESIGYDRATEFMARVRSAGAPPQPAAPTHVEDGPSDDTTPQGKATDKCRPKSSAKVSDSTDLSLDVADEMGDTIESQEADTSEAAGETGDTDQAEGEEAPEATPSTNMTSNEMRELIHGLMRKSKILDDCRARVRSAVSKAVAEHTKAMFKPFTGYIEDMGREVSLWHAGVLSIHSKMVECSYEKYRENSGLIRQKTNAFYECAQALNRSLDATVTPKRANRTTVVHQVLRWRTQMIRSRRKFPTS